jgi:prepilin-type N-terminal cleavage/methylation domain-containing protein
MKPSKAAFTLIELMVVVMIVGMVAGFAIPNYTKALGRAHRKDAENNLKIIHAAEMMYAARHDGVYTAAANLAAINTSLSLNLLLNGAVSYVCALTASGFTCTSNCGAFTVSITEATTLTCTGTCP